MTDTQKTIDLSPRFQVFISSPSGLDDEKSIVVEEIRSLSEHVVRNNGPVISAVAWPESIAAGTASYGQSVINRQTSHYDILVCLVGFRMGTPTPRANSGTEEEFDCAIEAILKGRRVQLLLFFSNILVRPRSLDPHQLMLVSAFREKASRLGVLYQTFGDHEELRHLVRISLREAYDRLFENSETSRYLPTREVLIARAQPKTIPLADVILRNRHTAPQWADSLLVPLAEYRRQNIRVTWTMKTSSPYFRFGFKYYDSREPRFSAGSVQTVGQNILIHVGKNRDNPAWFATSYRASYRLGADTPLDEMAGCAGAEFALEISSADIVRLSVNGKLLYELFFPIDGIPILAILAWGDEHEFLCEVCDLQVVVSSETV
ncbi:MAG TPA: DUF4062 domain-containing protein [Terriglobales bacterium]|nr:DUF4062 domain-containing protein [Terriglobales bacterium]